MRTTHKVNRIDPVEDFRMWPASSSSLIKLNDTEHLGVTDQGKSQPQQYPGHEKKSAKGSCRYFKVEFFDVVRLFDR